MVTLRVTTTYDRLRPVCDRRSLGVVRQVVRQVFSFCGDRKTEVSRRKVGDLFKKFSSISKLLDYRATSLTEIWKTHDKSHDSIIQYLQLIIIMMTFIIGVINKVVELVWSLLCELLFIMWISLWHWIGCIFYMECILKHILKFYV